MKTYDSANSTLIVLQKNENIIETLSAYAKEHQLAGGWVNIIGGVDSVTLGYYKPQEKEYQWQDFNEFLEIVGLQGNLAWIDGEPFWHIHGVFSRGDYTTIAGHVKEAHIALTGEVFLTPHDQKLTRVYDDDTGLKLLTESNE